MKSPKVDKELLPMKAHYFLFNAGTAPVVPFMPTLARQLGFSTVVVGTIYTILPIIGMLAKPFFGFIADRYQRHRLLFIIAQIITALAFFMIMFVPAIPLPAPSLQFHCHNGVADLRHCSNVGKCDLSNLQQHYDKQVLQCDLHCEAEPYMWDIVCADWLKDNSSECTSQRDKAHLDFRTYMPMDDMIFEEKSSCLYFMLMSDAAIINNKNVSMYCPKDKKYFSTNCQIDCHDEFLANQLSESVSIKNSDAFGMHQFWFFFTMLIISWIGMAVVVSIGDAICFSLLGDRHHLYGNQRLCGSIGWGIFAILAGVLVDAFSGNSVNKNYTVIFWMCVVLIGFDVFASTKLKHTQTHLSPNILKDIGAMFSSMRCIVFFIWCVMIGLCTALIWNFLFWYLEDLNAEYGGCENSMKTLEGFVMGVQCFGGELPFFFLSGWILKKIGHVNAMSLVLFGFGLRFILYSMLEDPWYVLPIELMNGITFGLFYATMASYVSIVSPPGTEATMQGLVGAIFEGIGVSSGSFIAGVLFESVGGAHTFVIFGSCALFAFVLHVCVQMFLNRRSSTLGTANNDAIRYLAPTDAMHMLQDQDYRTLS